MKIKLIFCVMLLSITMNTNIAVAANVVIDTTKVACDNFLGFGAEWDNYNSGLVDAQFQIITKRIQYMKLPLVRHNMYVVHWGCYVTSDNTYHWDTPGMLQLYRQLDVCQNLGITVFFTDWGIEANDPWHINRTEDPLYAEVIGTYMNYLINQRGYSCIKYFILVNEPNLEVGDFSRWKTGVQNVAQQFTSRGLNTKVIQAGSDESGNDSWHYNAVDQLQNILGCYDVHRYASQSDVKAGNLESYFRNLKDYALNHDPNAINKPFIVGEAGMQDGMSAGVSPYISTYYYGVFMADYAIQATRGGMSGVSAWMLDDNSHSGFDWGLWSEDLTLRPWFYPWSLLSRYVPKGSIVYKVDHQLGSDFRILASQDPSQGDWTFCIVNEGTAASSLVLSVSGVGAKSVSKYLYSEQSSIADADGFPVPVATENGNLANGISVACPPNSVVLINCSGTGVEDTTPPSAPGTVRDGTSYAADSNFTNSTTQLNANWDAATDAESGISGYQYAIGTSPAGTDVAGWTSVGNVTTVTKTGLTLTVGTTYYFNVKAMSSGGTGTARNSNGQFVKVRDLNNPFAYWKFEEGSGTTAQDSSGNGHTGTLYNGPIWTTGKINGGISFDGVNDTMTWTYTKPANDFSLCAWVKATTTHEIDTEGTGTLYSGTSGQRYLFGATNEGSDCGAGISVGTNGISVYEHGDNYMPALAVYSGTLGTGWNHIAIVYENKQPKIYLNGTLVRTGLTSTKSAVYAPVELGGWQYGSFPGTVDEVRIYAEALSGTEVQYIYNASGVNDTTPPSTPATVRDGTSMTDSAYTFSTTQLSANWDQAADVESGISKYYFAIGTAQGATNVTNGWITNNTNLTVTKTGLSLTVGTTYYSSVKAENGVGLQSVVANSNGQYVNAVNTADTTPPANITQVRDGNEIGTDTDVTYLTDELSANWSDSADAESGISRYLYAIGTSPGATDIANWTPTDNGELTNVTKSNLSLLINTTYYFSVKAENGVGLQSAAANSNGQLVLSMDSQGPLISNVSAQSITQTGATIMWETDEPSTSRVEYGLTIIYGGLTGEYIVMNTVHSVTLTGLQPGTQYHYRVISRDYAGNESVSVDQTFYTLPTTDKVTEVNAYPNPHDLSRPGGMKFKVSATGTVEVEIYTMTGKLVRKLTAQSGATEISWDGANENGERVAIGVYLYRITDSNGDKTTGKIAIIR